MLIAFISDIHANLVALEAVLKKIKKMKADEIFFLGDTVGYGPWPNECVSLISQECSAGVLGNHDGGVINRIDIARYYDAVRYTLEWSRVQLNEDNYKFLGSLPFIETMEEKDILLSHGSPRHPQKFEYLFEQRSVNKLYEIMPYLAHLNVSGHSHTMQLFILPEDGKAVELDISSSSYSTDTHHKMVCIAGSVGQPRDGDNRAGFITYDTEKKLIHFHRVEYNIEQVVNKINSLKLPRSFAMRLLQGV